ncbi:MAG: four helix bundle protein [Gemmatimonadaceae bacterium]|nr:four helix bundle protein [Gemmatimonadaceae bacterium]
MPTSSPSPRRAVVRSYRDLIVWQKAMTLARSVYELTTALPASERYGIAQQLRRGAVSVPANIAEGHGRMLNGDFVRSLSIARGSLHEVETFLLLSLDLGLLAPDAVRPAMALADEASRMLAVLIRRLGRKSPRR